MTPAVYIVGADKGGVGKTTVARALLDYLATRAVTPRVFDTQWPAGDLARFAPAAEVIDIDKVDGQRKVFDQLAGVTVIDIRGGSFSSILHTLDQVRLLEDVRQGAVALALLHVLGPSIASLNEISEAHKTIGGGSKHFIVKNHINDTAYSIADDPRYAEHFARMADCTIDVPQLKTDAGEMVQTLGVSFAGFAADPTQSRILRGYVLGWLGTIWKEFDRVGIGALLTEG